MLFLSCRSKLYRNAGVAVIFAALLCGKEFAQSERGKKANRGPRALGLIELSAKGRAQLIPITILINGEYYDASAYKASPVPMALWAGTVYEGVKTGISAGLFTITDPQQNRNNNEWFAEGRWQSAAELASKSSKRSTASSIPRGMNDDEGPPVLRHSGSEKPKPPEPTTAASAGSTSSQASSTSPSTPAPASVSTPGSSASSSPPTATPSAQDQDKPTLKRGRPSTQENDDTDLGSPEPTKTAPGKNTTSAPATSSQAELIPAISDANGPEPHSYVYEMKPDEQEQLRTKVMALAAEQVYGRAKQIGGGAPKPQQAPSALPKRHLVVTRPAPPDFTDVQFRAFDLYSSNEPTFVFTATARVQASSSVPASAAGLQYMVAVVARQDINGDFHKVFSNVADEQHLDVLPKYELIDAVDVDGDGNGELLFRQISDSGATFDVYRVIGDQLYPLFQGTP